jgi:hypothetical protein
MRLIPTRLRMLEVNLDRAHLDAASLGYTPEEVINRAVALHHAVMNAEPGRMLLLTDLSSGETLRLVRLPPKGGTPAWSWWAFVLAGIGLVALLAVIVLAVVFGVRS